MRPAAERFIATADALDGFESRVIERRVVPFVRDARQTIEQSAHVFALAACDADEQNDASADQILKMQHDIQRALLDVLDQSNKLDCLAEAVASTARRIDQNIAAEEASVQDSDQRERNEKHISEGTSDEESTDAEKNAGRSPMKRRQIEAISQRRELEREMQRNRLDYADTAAQVYESLADDYSKQSFVHKFRENPMYMAFIGKIWELENDSREVPLPDSRVFLQKFAAAEQIESTSTLAFSAVDQSGDRAAAAAGDFHDRSDDEEIVLESAQPSYKCPLTLRVISKPIRSSKCQHFYEESAIRELLNKAPQRRTACPVSGCGATLTLRTLIFDESLARRLERFKRKQQNERRR